MKLKITKNFDKTLAEIYSSKVTVNLENTTSSIDPNYFWSVMQVVAINHRAMLNYKLYRQ